MEDGPLSLIISLFEWWFFHSCLKFHIFLVGHITIVAGDISHLAQVKFPMNSHCTRGDTMNLSWNPKFRQAAARGGRSNFRKTSPVRRRAWNLPTHWGWRRLFLCIYMPMYIYIYIYTYICVCMCQLYKYSYIVICITIYIVINIYSQSYIYIVKYIYIYSYIVIYI